MLSVANIGNARTPAFRGHYWSELAATGLLLVTLGSAAASEGGSADAITAPEATQNYVESRWPVATYEAEAGHLSGEAAIIGTPDEMDRTVGDLGGEASHRQAAVLTVAGDSVSWPVKRGEDGASAVVVRFSLPDGLQGGGADGTLELRIEDSAGAVRARHTLRLNSRYSWLYGGVMDGTKLFNVPANATEYATAHSPTHLFDEIQLRLPRALHAGDTVKLTKTAGSASPWIAIDFIELETIPPALKRPPTFLSITDSRCGAIPVDLRHSNSVFDGEDDSSYGSVFHAVLGHNPYNPTGFAIVEKDYYSTDPGADALQDTSLNQLTHGLSMFELADHNFNSLQTCINLVSSSGGLYKGVWIPPGRFYARGLLQLPDDTTIQGAGIWYSKFASVDTAAPVAVTTAQGSTGIAGTSGNLVFSSHHGGARRVLLKNFSIFGNVTQRDVVDSVLPMGIHGEFMDSNFDDIWVEHEFIGINTNLNSSNVQISHARVRNTFADGIDFYGSTSHSKILHSNARSTGDDGFAMWSQGSTLSGISQSNAISHSAAELQWYGDGFAIYGGNGGSITYSTASDILNYPCLQVSTQFVPAALPASATMSAQAENLEFYRCGGNGFNQQFGALLVGTDLESVDGVKLDRIKIVDPTYRGIEVRSFASSPNHPVATLGNASLSNADVVGSPTCATIRAGMNGVMAFDNVCECTPPNGTAASCAVTNASAKTFQVSPNHCARTMCPRER